MLRNIQTEDKDGPGNNVSNYVHVTDHSQNMAENKENNDRNMDSQIELVENKQNITNAIHKDLVQATYNPTHMKSETATADIEHEMTYDPNITPVDDKSTAGIQNETKDTTISQGHNTNTIVANRNEADENSIDGNGNNEQNGQEMEEESKDESYHSSHSDPVYPYKYAVEKETRFYGLRDDGEVVNTLKEQNHSEWDHNDILTWILSLENGLFAQYKGSLEQSLKEGKINGNILKEIEPIYIKAWGIKEFKHQKKLYEHIQTLTNMEGK